MPCRKSKPAAMRRSSADSSSPSGLRTTAASRACENSRPIAAPICASSLAGPSRSSRAITLRLQHRLGHLLHEQGNTVGALDYVLLNAWWEELVANDAADHGLDVAPTQPIDGEGRDVGAADPRWIELRTERHDQKQAHAPNLVHSPTERFQACRVDPLHILKDHQHRTCSR